MRKRREKGYGALATVLFLPLALAGLSSVAAADHRKNNRPPEISGNPPKVATVGVTYSFTPTASDPDGDRLWFKVRNKPGWANFDSRTGRLWGKPQREGSYDEIRIVVTDGREKDRLPKFTISVEAQGGENMPPEISGEPPEFAPIGELYSFVPDASDPDGDRLTFTALNVPGWAEFNAATGEISGVPQADDEGIYGDISVTVSDGVSTASTPAFSITVGDEDTGPPPDDDDPTPDPGNPPSDPLDSIPAIPFDYARSPGNATRSGPMPTSLNAGEVLALSTTSMGDDFDLRCNGTQSNPAFVVGGTVNGSGDVFEVQGSWCIFIDTKFNNMQVRTSGDHLVFRNVEISNVAGKNGSNLGGSYIVLVDSEIHHNQGDDRHGVQISSGASNVWVLRNHIHHNGGDGIQGCHGCDSNPPSHVYIGNNLFHSDRENAVDFKYIENVIVEGNTIHSLVSAPADENWCFDDGSGCGTFSSGSDGSGIVVGSDGGPVNVLITNNEIYDTNNAVRIEEGVQIRIENNDFHDVEGRCLQLDKDGMNTVFSGNTCSNAARGIFQNWRDNFSLDVANNVFENVEGPAIEYEAASVGNASTLTNNVFRDSGPVVYGNNSASTAADINSLPGASGNRVE
jgi:hypothetical protein